MSREPTHPDNPVVQAVQVQQTLHYGPLPAPEAMEQYERALPGSVHRIICMAEEEMRHRHTQEIAALQSDMNHRAMIHATESQAVARGQYLGFSISVLSFAHVGK